MLSKILVLVVAGIFVGAAVMEILSLTGGNPAGKEPLPGQTPDEDAKPKQGYDRTLLQTQG